MKRLLCIAVLGFFLTALALTADNRTQPCGYGGVRLGDSRAAVSKAMGTGWKPLSGKPDLYAPVVQSNGFPIASLRVGFDDRMNVNRIEVSALDYTSGGGIEDLVLWFKQALSMIRRDPDLANPVTTEYMQEQKNRKDPLGIFKGNGASSSVLLWYHREKNKNAVYSGRLLFEAKRQ
jgi:hypothetical protein